MAQYIAFMRAVNVAGHARVSMDDVRAAFAAAGCGKVRSYIQSGNVVFEAPARDVSALLQRVRGKLRATLGEEPVILLRTLPEIERLIEECPFARRALKSGVKLYVVFLSGRARNRPAFPLASSKEALEAIAMTDREVFIVSYPKKSGFFGFPNNFIEQALGVPATSRNWSTVRGIAEFARRGDER